MGGNSSTNQHNNTKTNDIISTYYLNILEFCNYSDRYNLILVNKFIYKLSTTPEFYRWLCIRLSIEHSIYIPYDLPVEMTWKEMFLSYYPIRHMWEDKIEYNNDQKIVQKYKINVYAKFKPNIKLIDDDLESSDESINNVEITLPLHQRLSIIKLSHQLRDNRQALQILTNEGGWFAKKWENQLTNKQSNDELNIENCNMNSNSNTVVNIKKPDKMVAKIQTIDPGTGRVVVMAPDVGLREFTFDGVFGPSSSQKNVYNTTMKKLIVDLINGFNVTALVYGQTGSGKTFSMFGSDPNSYVNRQTSKSSNCIQSGDGIIPRTCIDIFTILSHRYINQHIINQISISYVEIYGNNIYDLLKSGQPCGHSKVSSQRYVLQGAAERIISNLSDIFTALNEGELVKRTAATAMNDRSTRAHSLVILSITQTNMTTNVKRCSKLFLADLGGSEQVKKSQVEAGKTGRTNQALGFELGDHMREAIYINLGLLSLKKCIDAINTKKSYIPYQDSKLTMLLSLGLGGNSRTSMIICNRMEGIHINETMTTLRFGEQCSNIENNSYLYTTMNLLNDLNNQIYHLESIIKEKEQWINESIEVNDIIDNQIINQKEKKIVSKLVGAENERKLLEQLLVQREQLVGNYVPTNSKSKVIGFGKELAELYNLGMKYNENDELNNSISRFQLNIQVDELPTTVKHNWIVDTNNKDTLELKAKTVKRNKLRYAGLAI